MPLLIRNGFKGNVIATQPTAEFCAINLPDCSHLNNLEVERYNSKEDGRGKKNFKKLELLYTEQEARESIDHIRCYDFNKEIIIDNRVKVILKKAGHILGACSPLIIYTNEDGKETKMLFTGDTSGKMKGIHPFIPIADDIGDVDYIVSESTYGDRRHTKNNPLQQLELSIKETCYERKKTLLIPCFSIQRSSELLWLLREIYLEHPEYEDVPIYLDSPMSCKAQVVMDRNREYWDETSIERDKELGNLFTWEQINLVTTPNGSKALANGEKKILVSASGMANGGRILHHLRSFLPSKGCKILFCGYQGNGTLGKKLLETNQKTIRVEGKVTRINAKIDFIEFSSHADYCQLIELFKTSKKGRVKEIFINHGNIEASKNLKKEIEQQLHIECKIPQTNEIVKIKCNLNNNQ